MRRCGQKKKNTSTAAQKGGDLIGLAVVRVDGADEEVIGDVVEVAAVLEPRARCADVVRRALALGLDQHRAVDVVLAVPLVR